MTSIVEVDFPAAETIDYGAFMGTGLVEVNFPAVTTIDRYAFDGCTDLISASFSAVTNVLTSAFGGCTSLAFLEIPAVEYIEDSIFQNTGSTALTIIMGAVAPKIDGDQFGWNPPAKNVTIQVPSGATGYDAVQWSQTWPNRFIGKWVDPETGEYDDVNINLTIEEVE
jgi:hypothetical protein